LLVRGQLADGLVASGTDLRWLEPERDRLRRTLVHMARRAFALGTERAEELVDDIVARGAAVALTPLLVEAVEVDTGPEPATEGAAAIEQVRVAMSPEDYKDWIVAAEAKAQVIDRVPKRISVVFKDPATVEAIAARRFGVGSRNVDHYVAEHEQRRTHFFSALKSGMRCREIYNTSELRTYVSLRRHGAVVIEADLITQTLERWVECIRAQGNYFVGITDDPVPFKYAVIDRATVVMHEAIGVDDRHRVNGIFIESFRAAHKFSEDFDVTWDRIPPERRDREYIEDWIEGALIPLASQGSE
jgi:hypothetical protein